MDSFIFYFPTNCLFKDIAPSIRGKRARYLVSEYRSETDTVPLGLLYRISLSIYETNDALGLDYV